MSFRPNNIEEELPSSISLEPLSEPLSLKKCKSANELTVELTADELEVVESKFLKECNLCNCVKPPRSHHCSKCGRCVMRMDHHCPWIGNCVGLQNMKMFLLFNFYVFWVTISTVVFCSTQIIYCLQEFDAKNDQPPSTIQPYKCLKALSQTNNYFLIATVICLFLALLFMIFVLSLMVD